MRPASTQRNDRVARVYFKPVEKFIFLDQEGRLSVPRFACVTRGDPVMIRGARRIGLYVVCRNGLAQILPAYDKQQPLELGDRRILIRVKEITESCEMEGYLNLAAFHYRNEELAGRRAPLVAISEASLGPRVLGYIELSTSFIMNKARQQLLDAPFQDSLGIASWQRWDVAAARRFTNLSVRIARCVVHPEYRGLGLGRVLCRHAIEFARSRWQVGGLRPYFIEITADMLKFVPFVAGAGMIYIGDTEGNLHRVAKDMRYLASNFDRVKQNQILRRGGGGIVAVQKKYVGRAVEMLTSLRLSPDDFADRLSIVASSLTPAEYFGFHGLLRLPKPTYIKGLVRASSTFVRRRIRELALKPPAVARIAPISPLKQPIRVNDLTAVVRSSVELTSKTMQVQEAFGIRPDHLRSVVFSKLNFEIHPGAIVLIYGASGSGKTTLLRVLSGQSDGVSGIEVSGSVDMPRDAVIASFEPLPEGRPLVELLGDDDVSRSLYCLNTAGLSEAQLYLRHFEELSNGQRYRAMLARLIDSGANVWIADEFLATLDPVTACVVAKNIRQHAKRAGVTLIAGAPHYEHFLSSLDPDMVVHMYAPWEYRVLSGEEFRTQMDRPA